MRYYHYGKAKELEANDRIREQKDRRYAGKLVIEEDTIYEIDEDCMHCLEQKRKAGTVKSSRPNKKQFKTKKKDVVLPKSATSLFV